MLSAPALFSRRGRWPAALALLGALAVVPAAAQVLERGDELAPPPSAEPAAPPVRSAEHMLGGVFSRTVYRDVTPEAACAAYPLDGSGIAPLTREGKSVGPAATDQQRPLHIVLLRQSLPEGMQVTEMRDGTAYRRTERDILIVHQGYNRATENRLAEFQRQFGLTKENVTVQVQCDRDGAVYHAPFTRFHPETGELQHSGEAIAFVNYMFERQAEGAYPWVADFNLSPLAEGDETFVVEKTECASDGNFIVGSMSRVSSVEPDKVTVRRQRMIAVKNNYGASGEPTVRSIVERSLDPTHYWCAPTKREFCYKTVDFGQFQVDARPDAEASFDRSHAYNLSLGLVSAFQKAFVDHCPAVQAGQ